jgi:hypothetical protein
MELDQLTELIMWIEQGQFLVDQDYAKALGPEFAVALKLQNAIVQSLISGGSDPDWIDADYENLN